MKHTSEPPSRQQTDEETLRAYWSVTPDRLLPALHTGAGGLQEADAELRLRQFGLNTIRVQQRATAVRLLLRQFRSALVLILVFAAIVSIIVGEWVDATIVLAIVMGSTILGFAQEYNASNAVERLRSQITIRSSVLRDGQPRTLPSDRVVPGDVVMLSAGSLIPADGMLLEADDFFVNQAVLTGETFPVEKKPGTVSASASLAERVNCVFMGTSVRSGTARALIARTGKSTVFGEVAERLVLRPPETEFERGIRNFGNLLTQVMLVMVAIVLAVNLYLGRPPIDSLLFALALAVGLTPELLPAIISITLAAGAQQMARRGVIVRRLSSVENFGSMDTLCTDKTGTLTEGVVRLDGAHDARGEASQGVLRLAFLNAQYQTGLSNPMDDAIQEAAQLAGLDPKTEQKIDEIPYDFVRKRLSMVTADAQGRRTLITKGALENVLAVCTSVRGADETPPLDFGTLAEIRQRYDAWSQQGFRVLGVATKPVEARPGSYPATEEDSLTFEGFLLFFDPPKESVRQVIPDLTKRGVEIKIITGDNEKVTRHVAAKVSLPIQGALTGRQLNELNDEALLHLAERTNVFSEVDPNQKERIIRALQKSGHVVGYMGDGINDAPALHAADVGISVDSAVDVAKEAADFVLLKQDLDILRKGIDGGRVTFANTLKYLLTTISANFGNMFSMGGASLLLPFLPMLAPQILLNNFLSDIPAATIANDNVDPEMVQAPHRWNTRFIRDYMVLFGLVSSMFDFLTFGTLLYLFRASPVEFRTGWFVESLVTELVIALVVRTRHVFWRSRPGRALLWTSVLFILIALLLPYLPHISIFGFVPLPAPLMLVMLGLVGAYVLATEVCKRFFYSRVANMTV
jgi:Mg2+-importing ATPase